MTSVTALTKTKTRIVQAAIGAFNDASFAQVTTASLAARLDMAEGNLWYHYRTKAQLLEAIQKQFMRDWHRLSDETTQHGDPVDDYVIYMRRWQSLFRGYLFLFRDRSEYGNHSPALVASLPDIYAEVSGRLIALYHALLGAGCLTLPSEDIPDLATNVAIITRFFLEFAHEARPDQTLPANAGLLQHLSLLKPHLDAATLLRLEHGLRSEG